jgi:DNA-binding PadR family transcriptional regulator
MCSRCGCVADQRSAEVRPAVVEGIVEPALLTVLAEGADHGYELARAIRARGLVPGELSRARVYEALARLEEDGAIEGEHEASDEGPDRRRYAITESGRARLARWVVALGESERAIRRLIAASSRA